MRIPGIFTVCAGTTEEWNKSNPILEKGEIGVNLTTNNLKIGDGIRRWSDLPYVVEVTDYLKQQISNEVAKYVPEYYETYEKLPKKGSPLNLYIVEKDIQDLNEPDKWRSGIYQWDEDKKTYLRQFASAYDLWREEDPAHKNLTIQDWLNELHGERVYIKYASSKNPKKEDMHDEPVDGDYYIGVGFNKPHIGPPEDTSDYEWTICKGLDARIDEGLVKITIDIDAQEPTCVVEFTDPAPDNSQDCTFHFTFPYIVDRYIHPDAGIQQTKIAGLVEALASLEQSIADSLISANGYTDTKFTEAKEYSDAQLNAAKEDLSGNIEESLSTAKKYTDSEVGKAKGQLTDDIATALDEGKQYTDDEIAKAKSYTDTKSSQALADAKSYTDKEISGLDSKLTGTINDTKSALDKSIADTKSELETEIAEGDTTLDTRITNEVSKLNAAIEKSNTDWHTADTQQYNKITKEYKAADEVIRSELQQVDESIKAQINDHLSEYEAHLAASDSAHQDLQSKHNAQQKLIEGLDTELDTFKDATNKELAEKATKQELKEAVSHLYKYKGAVDTYELLPSEPTPVIGDTYHVNKAHGTTPAGTNYAWNGEAWDPLGGDVDLAPYSLKTELTAAIAALANVARTGKYSDLSGTPTALKNPNKLSITVGSDTTNYDGAAAVAIAFATIAKTGKLADAADDTTHRLVTDAEKTSWNNKQNALTFDTVPKSGSSNPITSGAVYTINDTLTKKFAGYLPLTGGALSGGLTAPSFTEGTATLESKYLQKKDVDVLSGTNGVNVSKSGTAVTIKGVRATATSDGVMSSDDKAKLDAFDIASAYAKLTALNSYYTKGEIDNKAYATKSYVDTAIPKLSATTNGTGNAVTGITANGHELTITKGETFAKQADVNALTFNDLKRINIKGYTKPAGADAVQNWYYPIAELPTDNSGNYASVIITGRIGGWVKTNMSYINAIVSNRDKETGSIICLGDNTTNALKVVDIVLYRQDTNRTIVYLKCNGYFTFDINLNLMQATYKYNGTYTTEPTGTESWAASTSTNSLYVNTNGGYIKDKKIATESWVNDKSFALSSHKHTNDSSIGGPYATTQDVNNAISGLVNGAGTALDTLKELADALGNDPNFATTIANQIGSKANASDLAKYMPLTGGQFTGPVTWTGEAIVEDKNPQYFLTMKSFSNGGGTYWSDTSDAKNSLGITALETKMTNVESKNASQDTAISAAQNTANNAMPKSGGQFTGRVSWNGTSLPEQTASPYFVTIEAFAKGGKTYYTSQANVKSNLGITKIERERRSFIPTGTSIPANADLNTTTYLKVGSYYCSANNNAQTLKNSPTQSAFCMEVFAPLAKTYDDETTGIWKYRVRKIMTHSGEQYIQHCNSGETAGKWAYGGWDKISTESYVNNKINTSLAGYYTKTQTDSAISTAVSNLVSSAPADLDTLKELATALGNDKNFSTTVLNKIASKADASELSKYLPLAGGTVTGTVTFPNGASINTSGYVTGTLLATTKATDLNTKPEKIAVIGTAGSANNHIYYRTPAEILSDINAASTNDLAKYLPLTGGTMTGELRVNGGDQSGVSKIVLETNKGQITNSSTGTLFGYTGTNLLSVGHSTVKLQLRGNSTRPTYNGNDLALKSDVGGGTTWTKTYSSSDSSWGATNSNPPYKLVISATTHGKGKNPQVEVYYGTSTDPTDLMPGCYSIASTGNVTIWSNYKIGITVKITG